jgi:hypothetical protein
VRVVVLGLYVKSFVVIFRIDIHRQVQLLRIGPGKTCIAVRAPLHGSTDSVAVAEIDVVAHADFVAIIKDRRPR